MTTAWSHLPNAVHIDRILASVKTHPEVWVAARGAARGAAGVEARYAVGYAVIALIAWDNSAKFLDMTVNELKMWRALSEDPAALLLLPAVRAFEQIEELVCFA